MQYALSTYSVLIYNLVVVCLCDVVHSSLNVLEWNPLVKLRQLIHMLRQLRLNAVEQAKLKAEPSKIEAVSSYLEIQGLSLNICVYMCAKLNICVCCVCVCIQVTCLCSVFYACVFSSKCVSVSVYVRLYL